jgi:putative acetyltransferase
MSIETRESVAGDDEALVDLYPLAFPDEDLLPLVRELRQWPGVTLSLVATMAAAEERSTGPAPPMGLEVDVLPGHRQDPRRRGVVGHVLFTTGVVDEDLPVALLGPLAVTPAMQRRGVGSALVRDGLSRLRTAGIVQAFVLGDPAYYGRFCFVAESRVAAPYPLPDEWQGAWQSLVLIGDAPKASGTLRLPAPWMKQAFWSP